MFVRYHFKDDAGLTGVSAADRAHLRRGDRALRRRAWLRRHGGARYDGGLHGRDWRYFRTRENGEGLGSSTGKKNVSGLVALLRIDAAAAGGGAGGRGAGAGGAGGCARAALRGPRPARRVTLLRPRR